MSLSNLKKSDMRKRDFKIIRNNAKCIIGILVKKVDFYPIDTVNEYNPFTLEYYGEGAYKCDKCGLHKYCKPDNYVYSLCDKVSYECARFGKDTYFLNACPFDPIRTLWTPEEWDDYFETPEGKIEAKEIEEEWLSMRSELEGE